MRHRSDFSPLLMKDSFQWGGGKDLHHLAWKLGLATNSRMGAPDTDFPQITAYRAELNS